VSRLPTWVRVALVLAHVVATAVGLWLGNVAYAAWS
jgi:hypothetical protein